MVRKKRKQKNLKGVVKEKDYSIRYLERVQDTRLEKNKFEKYLFYRKFWSAAISGLLVFIMIMIFLIIK